MTSQIETAAGTVEGRSKDGIHRFTGVPFAAPLTAERRWLAPQPPEPWAGVRDCTRYGQAAPQERIPMMEVGQQGPDCLVLNVWTPGLDDAKRPVLVWFHGGGFLIGSSAQREYNGGPLARRGDVVVVSANYRLGALGYADLAPVLGDKLPSDANRGVRDQIAALQWVRDHIARFGGDPGNVTIFGESAGGMSVSTLMGTPAAQGLFHRAIPQSGAAHHVVWRDQTAPVVERLLKRLGASAANPDALRTASGAELVKAQRGCLGIPIECGPWRVPQLGMPFVPVVDGELLPEQPQDGIAGGLARNVALLTGTTMEEWKLFSQLTMLVPAGEKSRLPAWADLGDDDLPRVFEDHVPGHGERLLAFYRQQLGADAAPGALFSALETDRIFRIPALRLVEAQLAHQPATYMYRFDWRSPTFGAGHAVDLPFVFGSIDSPFGMMFTGGGEHAHRLSEQVMDAWLNFARSGDPGHGELPDWPRYGDDQATLHFDRDCRLGHDPEAAHREAWDAVR